MGGTAAVIAEVMTPTCHVGAKALQNMLSAIEHTTFSEASTFLFSTTLVSKAWRD